MELAWDSLFSALSLIMEPSILGYVFVGVIAGLALGILPGLGGIAGMSILIALLAAFQSTPVPGIAMAIGMIAVIPTSDTFASVLLGIPGSSASQATVLDGFPLSKKGEAARALSAAFTSSLFGGILGVFVLTAIILVASDVITYIRSPAQFMLAVLGIALVGLLAGRSLLKGFLAAGLGIFFGLLGAGDIQGVDRLLMWDVVWVEQFSDWLGQFIPASESRPRGPVEEFQRYLRDGLKVGMVGLAMFAIPEIVDLLRQDKSIAGDNKLGLGWFRGFRDWLNNVFLSLWNAFIGVIVGIVPGLGGSVVDWIAYGQTKAIIASRGGDVSQFGKGDIRGVIGPESANNAKEGGGLVPTLLLGLPGSGSMAIFLGILSLYGLDAGIPMFQSVPLGDSFNVPGSEVIVTGMVITFFIAWTLMIANVMGTGLCFGLSPAIARITKIPFPTLAPFLLVVIFFAVYKISGSISFYSFITLLLLGGLGILLRRFNWSRPAFLIGFVLASPLETKFNAASQYLSSGRAQVVDWTIVIVIAVLVIGLVIAGILTSKNEALADEMQPRNLRERLPGILFAGLIAVIFGFMLLEPLSYGLKIYALGSNISDAQMPHFVGLVMFPLALFAFLRLLFNRNEHQMTEDMELIAVNSPHAAPRRGLLGSYGIIAGFVALIAVFGFLIGTALFVTFLLFTLGRGKWWLKLLLVVAAMSLFVLLADLVNPRLSRGFAQQLYPEASWFKPIGRYIQKPQFPFVPQ